MVQCAATGKEYVLPEQVIHLVHSGHALLLRGTGAPVTDGQGAGAAAAAEVKAWWTMAHVIVMTTVRCQRWGFQERTSHHRHGDQLSVREYEIVGWISLVAHSQPLCQVIELQLSCLSVQAKGQELFSCELPNQFLRPFRLLPESVVEQCVEVLQLRVCIQRVKCPGLLVFWCRPDDDFEDLGVMLVRSQCIYGFSSCLEGSDRELV